MTRPGSGRIRTHRALRRSPGSTASATSRWRSLRTARRPERDVANGTAFDPSLVSAIAGAKAVADDGGC